jgi:Flp pilus assembly pilin Flp
MLFRQFSAMLLDDGAQSLVEYALVIGLVAIAAVGALAYFGHQTNNALYGNISNAMNNTP